MLSLHDALPIFAVCSSVRWKCMGSALAAHREVARQAESPFADDVALDVRRPARDRIAEAAHDLIHPFFGAARPAVAAAARTSGFDERSEEHTSELQPLMRTSYAVLCLKK